MQAFLRRTYSRAEEADQLELFGRVIMALQFFQNSPPASIGTREMHADASEVAVSHYLDRHAESDVE